MRAAPRYLSLLAFPDAWLDRLRRAAPGVEVVQVTASKLDDVPAELWAEVDVLHTSSVLPDPELARALRWVQLDTSGVDHVRDTPLWNSDVALTTIGGVSPVPLAEYVLFAILGFAHRLPELLDVQRSRLWPPASQRWERFGPAAPAGATVGVVGYGRIGREIARLATAHGMSVVGVTRTGRRASAADRARQVEFGPVFDDADVEVVGTDRLAEVAARSDYLVVVCPLTEQTRGLVDVEVLAAAKPGSVLVNVARGGIVDEPALLAQVRSGRIAGAVLDVFETEPLPMDSPWWDEPNVFVTPHVAGLAPRYADQVLEIVATNLRRLRDGHPLLNLVDRAKGY